VPAELDMLLDPENIAKPDTTHRSPPSGLPPACSSVASFLGAVTDVPVSRSSRGVASLPPPQRADRASGTLG
jgi:hypothetical protein